MPTIGARGVEFHYQDQGEGPPVLFIHGMCGDAGVWDGQVTRLSTGLRCISYDRRGHTRTPLGNVAERTVELHADDAASLVDALGIAPCHLVASSGGARVGFDAIRRYPQLFRSAVLCEPPLMALDPGGAEQFVGDLRPRIGMAMESGGGRAAVDAFFEYVCPGLWGRLDDAGKERYRANHIELFGDLQMPLYPVGTADLAEIRVPVLMVTGADSHPLFRNIARTLAAGIAGAELLEFAQCGHVTYVEQPERFATAVREFTARHS